MAVDVTTRVEIARPVGTVSVFACDPSNVPAWYANIRSVEWLTPPPAAVGSRLAFVAHFLGRRLAYTYEITELDPDRRLVMRTAEGPFPMTTTYTFEAAGPSATVMSLNNSGRPSGFSLLVAPFMSMAVRRANQKDLAALKRVLEAREQ